MKKKFLRGQEKGPSSTLFLITVHFFGLILGILSSYLAFDRLNVEFVFWFFSTTFALTVIFILWSILRGVRAVKLVLKLRIYFRTGKFDSTIGSSISAISQTAVSSATSSQSVSKASMTNNSEGSDPQAQGIDSLLSELENQKNNKV